MRPRLLVVEDTPAIGHLLSALLTEYGYDVTVCETGEQGLQAAMAVRPGLVLLDLGLPGLSGVDVCRRLKADPSLRRIPILVMTGSADALEQGEEFARLHLGVEALIAKPFSLTDVVRRVKALAPRPAPLAEAV